MGSFIIWYVSSKSPFIYFWNVWQWLPSEEPFRKPVFNPDSAALRLDVHIILWVYQQPEKASTGRLLCGVIHRKESMLSLTLRCLALGWKLESCKGSKPIWSSISVPRWARSLETNWNDNSFVARSPRNKARAGRANGEVDRQLEA